MTRSRIDDSEWDWFRTEEGSHGRHEVRTCYVTANLDDLRDSESCKGLAALVVIDRERTVGEKVSLERQFYITSLATTGEEMLSVIRSHWGVENSCHWVLDMAFREDESRVRSGQAAANLAAIRRLALNTLRNTPSKRKVGVQTKRLKAAWDNEFLMSAVLSLDS